MSKVESLTKTTFKGFFWSAGGKAINAISQIVVLVVLARLISPKSFGIVQAALIVIGFAKVFSHMGIGPALVQFYFIFRDWIFYGIFNIFWCRLYWFFFSF